MGVSERPPNPRPRTEKPGLEVSWANVWEPLVEAVRTLFMRLPVLPADITLVAFRDAAVEPRRPPSNVLLLSLTLHVLFVVLPLPEFLTRPPARLSALDTVRIEYDLQWTGTSRVLPPISPTPERKPKPSPASAGGRKNEPLPPRGADVVQEQTIVSTPPQPNHPTQTLLQQFGLEKARVQTAEVKLPNMVIPPTSTPATEIDLRRLRLPGAPVDLTGPPAAPVVPRPKSRAELALQNTRLENLLPRLTLPTSTGTEGPAAAPEVNAPAGTSRSGDQAAAGVIALAPNPAAPAPVMQLPEANLRARFVAGPFPGQGSPGGVGGGVPGASGGSGGGPGGEGSGPGGLVAPDILVTPAGPVPPGPVIVGVGSGAGAPAPPPASPPAKPEAESAANRQSPADRSSQLRAEQLLEGIRPGTIPGEGAPWRRVYTIYINMPNLTSQTGSWILRFAELGDASQAAAGGAADNDPLSAPVPIHKVDPRYSAAARRNGVEGIVSLYGIIRSDGSVANVQVVRGVHAELDQSAVAAFQRWVFEPGHKNGAAVNLEVVVEIPFRLNRLF
jgi:TonB family protein